MSMKQAAKQILKSAGLLEPLKAVIYGVKNSIHLFREFIYRLPNPAVRIRQVLTQDEKLKRVRADFRRDGIVVLDSYFSARRLQELRADFERFVQKVEASEPGPIKMTPDGGVLHPSTPYAEEEHSAEAITTVSNDPFKHSRGFLELALDTFILDIIEGYIGKRFMLQQSTAARYYPNERTNFGSWQWHHDAWGRKINVMILFTDVTDKDQYMNYMKGSHKIYHNLYRTSVNDRFTEEEVNQMYGKTAFKCLGKAGTVFIFDANGFHRGNRNLGAMRDTLINQYTAGRYLWSFDIPQHFLTGLSESQIAFLKRNPNIHLTH